MDKERNEAFDSSLDWHLLNFKEHKEMQLYVKNLNECYKNHPALYEKGFSMDGFEWINYEDALKTPVCHLLEKGMTKKMTL